MLKKKKAEPKSQHEFVSARKWSTREEMDRCPRKSIFLVLRGHPFGVQTCVQLLGCQLARLGQAWLDKRVYNKFNILK